VSSREHGRHREEESAVQEETDDEKKKLLQIIERDGEEEDEEVNHGCSVGNEQKPNCFSEMSILYHVDDEAGWSRAMCSLRWGLFFQRKDIFLKRGSVRGENKDFSLF